MADIESIRKKLNLTQQEFSQSIGMSRRSYTYRLAGDGCWTIKELIRIHDLCKEDIQVKYGIDNYSITIKKI